MTKIEVLKRYLFATPEELASARVSDETRRSILRTREVYEYIRDNPQIPEVEVAQTFQERFRVSRRLSYDLLSSAKVCLGILGGTSREFIRWKFYTLCEEGLSMAREKKDPGAFARILGVMSKAARLDREDGEAADYSAIVPQQFEITADPTDAGYTVIPDYNKRKRELFKKYAIEVKEDAKAYSAPSPLNVTSEE